MLVVIVYLRLEEGLLAVLLVSLQLPDINGVVAAVQVGQLHEQLMGSLQLSQGTLIVSQLVGIASRPL